MKGKARRQMVEKEGEEGEEGAGREEGGRGKQ